MMDKEIKFVIVFCCIIWIVSIIAVIVIGIFNFEDETICEYQKIDKECRCYYGEI